MRSSLRQLAGVALVAVGWAASAHADWPNFRGPNYDGISPETGFKKDWDQPIPVLWSREIGSGFSSFATVGDRLYTAGTKEKQQVVYCLNANTGETIWEKPFEPQYKEAVGGDGPRATPTVDENRVYMLGALGTLICLDSESGAEIWQTKFNHVPQWGYSGSVLIEGDLAISSGGKDDGALVAFDKRTGKQVWKTGDDPAGYATPYPFSFEGTRYIVGFTGDSAIIVEASTGREVWRTEWKTDWDVNAAAPVYHDGHLFLSSGYKTGCALFKLTKTGHGLSANEVWRSKDFMNKFQSCILFKGNLYTSDQNALHCADFLTGKERWREKRLEGKRTKHGTLILADEHLIYLMENGTLLIGKADPKAFEARTKTDILDGRCWTVPVLHRDKLYARNLERLVCLDLRGS
ncbi:MAG: PQQ-binding-like beta-propeller repeat protein [Phycisphaerae bacterium]|nr:PQQ-binding-like beta-propeller repeat protein [Phycisphaerae bacterium]